MRMCVRSFNVPADFPHARAHTLTALVMEFLYLRRDEENMLLMLRARNCFVSTLFARARFYDALIPPFSSALILQK